MITCVNRNNIYNRDIKAGYFRLIHLDFDKITATSRLFRIIPLSKLCKRHTLKYLALRNLFNRIVSSFRLYEKKGLYKESPFTKLNSVTKL